MIFEKCWYSMYTYEQLFAVDLCFRNSSWMKRMPGVSNLKLPSWVQSSGSWRIATRCCRRKETSWWVSVVNALHLLAGSHQCQYQAIFSFAIQKLLQDTAGPCAYGMQENSTIINTFPMWYICSTGFYIWWGRNSPLHYRTVPRVSWLILSCIKRKYCYYDS